MDDETLNKWLHENILGGHWHVWKDLNHRPPFYKYGCWCGKSVLIPVPPQPNYCESLDAVHKVEERVIEKVGNTYIKELNRLMFRQATTDKPNWSEMATARQRAEACKTAWEINETNTIN